MRMKLLDAQDALSFAVQQATYIEQEVYSTPLVDIVYPDLAAVDSSAPEWSPSVTFFSMDQVGRAEWFSAQADDVPLADVTRTKYEQPVELAAIGYEYNIEELSVASILGQNISAERGLAARRAAEEFVQNVFFNGDVDKGWTGLLNQTNAVSQTAAAGGGGTRLWSDKTATEILSDVTAAYKAVLDQTKGLERPDTMLLPLSSLTSLSTTIIDGTATSVLDVIQRMNPYTALTGMPLRIRGLIQLETVSKGRAVLYSRNPQVLKLHLPMSHRFTDVWRVGPLRYAVPGIFRTGGLDVRRPKAICYINEIVSA